MKRGFIQTLALIEHSPVSEPNVLALNEPLQTELPAPHLWDFVGQQCLHDDFSATHQLAVKEQINWLKKHPDYLYRVTRRSEPYAHHVVQQTINRQLPIELALIPMVESTYDGFAYSEGRAAGLWQFIPATGLHFGLQQNWWYDGRRDVIASTEAALTYFEQLYNRFDDWKLALAAYNAGPARIARAIKKNQRKGLPIDYWSLQLPKETQRYVPRLLAIREVLRHRQQYGISVYTVANSAYFEAVEIGSQIDLAQAASMADIDIKMLYQLNPGLSRWASPPEGPHRLAIPVLSVETLLNALATSNPSERLSWQRYQVKQGDTLSGIADHFDTRKALIMQANTLSSTLIKVGDVLMIPKASKSNAFYVLSDKQRKQRLNGNRLGKTAREYIVENGDSWWKIGQKYSVSVNRLAEWNGMAAGDVIRPGQKLTIWVNNNNKSNVSVTRTIVYKVKAGDNLSGIAARYKVSVSDLKVWNAPSRNKYLQPGQVLKVKVAVAGGF